MTTEDQFLKKGWTEWYKRSAKIPEVVRELENDIERMRDRRVAEGIIDQKDSMLDTIIDYHNTTDQLIDAYRRALINKNSEIMILYDCLKHLMQTDVRDRIFNRLTSDINELKEREILKQELINKING